MSKMADPPAARHAHPAALRGDQYPAQGPPRRARPGRAARLRDGAANFTVNTTVHIHAPSAMAIGMTVSVAGSSADIRKEVPAGESTVAVLLAVYGPTLWWPRGTALSGSISTVLTVLSWICVGMEMCGGLPSPVLA